MTATQAAERGIVTYIVTTPLRRTVVVHATSPDEAAYCAIRNGHAVARVQPLTEIDERDGRYTLRDGLFRPVGGA